MQQSLLDSIGGPVLFVGSAAFLALAGEIGFRSADRFGNPHQESQANVVTAALLGILGLLLAFSFGIVEGRYAERKTLVVHDANAIDAAYLRARMLPEPQGAHVRQLLRSYVDAKLSLPTALTVTDALDTFERIQSALWEDALAVAKQNPQSIPVGLFVNTLNEMIDVHHERVAVVLYHRLPQAMLLTLYVVAILALALHGYSAGLVHVRVALPALGLIVSLSSVLFLIVELDRPFESVFHISQSPFVTVRKAMTP
jgi:hypothetical protein